jgi:hypothetical protein
MALPYLVDLVPPLIIIIIIPVEMSGELHAPITVLLGKDPLYPLSVGAWGQLWFGHGAHLLEIETSVHTVVRYFIFRAIQAHT